MKTQKIIKKTRINASLTLLTFFLMVTGCNDHLSEQDGKEVNDSIGTLKSADLTAYVNPDVLKQEISFGGDGKLTIKDWAEKDVNSTCQYLFSDMNLQVLRIPIFALQSIDDPIYDKVITVASKAKSKNPNVKIFASLANGDGYGNQYHGADKFPGWMKGCCPYNIYDMNLDAYAGYLDRFVERMNDGGVQIDYLGPWNEDDADADDHRKVFDQMDELGYAQRIGVERWSLQNSINEVGGINSKIDIAGSHFYDDDQIPESSWRDKWQDLVNNSSDPVWYTEATRYETGDGIEKLVNGMNNIFPAIRGGAEHVVFYQVVKRFVYANGTILPIKYSGFKNIVNNATGKRRVPSWTTASNDVKVVSFAKNKSLSVHLINLTSNSKTTRIYLKNGYKAQGTITRTIWTSSETESSNSYNLSGQTSWNVTVPANSYVHVDVPLNNNAGN